MRGYSFSESDLTAISLTNIITTVAFAFGFAILTFCLDLKTDLILAESQTQKAMALDFSVNWFGIPVAVVFLLVGGIAWKYRGDMIQRVKEESEDVDPIV